MLNGIQLCVDLSQSWVVGRANYSLMGTACFLIISYKLGFNQFADVYAFLLRNT
jgi:hypothetical protein